MDQFNNTERGYHTFLQLLRMLELHKVAGTWGYDWKRVLRQLKEKSSTFLNDEILLLSNTLLEISSEMIELKKQGLTKNVLKVKVEGKIAEIVKKEMNISV